MDNFVNLHCHTMFSIQDSVIRISDLVKKVQEYGQSAVAITDHASCAGWVEFNKTAQDAGVKPIFGNEFYCIPEYTKGSRRRDHLVLLAKNKNGLINIRRLQRLAVENFYYKPLLSYELLKENPHDGIYCTSACSLSTISKYILQHDIESAMNYAQHFYEIFDGDFALELQFHPSYKDQNIINESLVKISQALDIPLTVSFDSHFLDENDRELRRIVQAISWKKKFDEVNQSLESNCLGTSRLVMEFALQSNFKYMDILSSAINQTQEIC